MVVRRWVYKIAELGETYKKPTRVSSVEMEADSKDGQVVEPEREMQDADMVPLLGQGMDRCARCWTEPHLNCGSRSLSKKPPGRSLGSLNASP